MNIVIVFISLLFGHQVGKDDFGNRYYKLKNIWSKKEKRWVLYKKSKEPSKISPTWDMWLRFVIQDPISDNQEFPWQKSRVLNLTGTIYSYNPTDYNKKINSYNNYTAWTENKD